LNLRGKEEEEIEMKALMKVKLGLAIGALCTAAAVAGAQPPAGGPGFGDHHPPFERALGPQGNHGRWWNNPEMVEKLKLTDDQRKQMDGILLQHRETLIDLRGNVEKAELLMEPLMRDDQPNEAKILAQIDKVAQARAELEKANARFLLAIRGKLTPEQWKTLQADRGNRHGDKRDGGRGWQPGGQDQRGAGHRQAPPPPPPGPQGGVDDEPGSDAPGNPVAGTNQ
jgi:Spy/CpxP family protein refolding chaperone